MVRFNMEFKFIFISVPERRIEDAVCCLKKVIDRFPDITARELAQVVGKIISMTPVMGVI